MEEDKNLDVEIFNDKEMMNRIRNKLELKSYKYKDLCVLLGEKAIDSKNSHGKNSQLKRWQRFFKLVKKGHSIIITKIYDIPLFKVENRGGNKPFKYLDDLQDALVDYFYKAKIGDREIPFNLEPTRIMEIIGMINPNYHWGNKYRHELSYYLEMNKRIIDDFYTSSLGEFTRIIENAFNKLEVKEIFYWEKTFFVTFKSDNNHTLKHKMLDKVEYKYFKEIEKNIMEYMKFENMFQIIQKGKMLEFKMNVIAMINKNKKEGEPKIRSYSKYYKFLVINRNIEIEFVNVVKRREQLNTTTTKRIKDKVKYIYENYIEEESNIDKEDYKLGNDDLMRYMFDLLEYDMKMNSVLEEFRVKKIHISSRVDAGMAKVRYVTKKERKEIKNQKQFEDERDALWTPEEFEDLSR